MVNSWNDTLLSGMFSNYYLKDIYNSDEFGLFSLYPPDRSYHLKNEKCSGGKHIDLRITRMATTNALGEKLRMLVNGKVKKPRCFKNVKAFICRCRNQRKSWMDVVLFQEWIRQLDY